MSNKEELVAKINAAKDAAEVLAVYDQYKLITQQGLLAAAGIIKRDVGGTDTDIFVMFLLVQLGLEEDSKSPAIKVEWLAAILKHDEELKIYVKQRIGKNKLFAQIDGGKKNLNMNTELFEQAFTLI
jgi:hypothetical protein